MARFTGFDEVYSALYVDFDNIYTRFLEADPEAARAFGMAPYRWVRWIENHALRILYGDGVRRRILKRMCYLNPLSGIPLPFHPQRLPGGGLSAPDHPRQDQHGHPSGHGLHG